MKLFSQNSKMKKSGKFFNFGIPAFRSISGELTCPMANDCISGCYAKSGSYNYPNVKDAYERRLDATKLDNFVLLANTEIQWLQLTHGQDIVIRVHDSGDFYSEEYALKWFNIAKQNPTIQFYAYTKMVSMIKRLRILGLIPQNFVIIFSFGGKEDNTIDKESDRYAIVFENAESIPADHSDASENDAVASHGWNNKIALVYHGNKKYSNTRWNKVI